MMAIFRNVHITFWTDPKVVDDFTPEDRYFYVYLLTNPHTNLCGCYEISKTQMSRELGYDEKTIERLVERFHDTHKLLQYNEETKEMLLYNWSKYNWTKSPKFQAALVKEIPKVKHSPFNEFLTKRLNGDTVSIRYGYGMDTTVSVSVTDTVTNTVIDNKEISAEKQKASPSKADVEEFFESVWKLYPRKKGKGAVSEAKRKALYAIGFEEIERAIRRYLEEWKKDSSWRKQQDGSTFFNSGYVDYLDKNFVPDKEGEANGTTSSAVGEVRQRYGNYV